jgi:hypothetical protein
METQTNAVGDIAFTVPVPIEESDAARADPAADGSIWIGSVTHREVLRLCPNGDIFVRGALVENDRQVVDGLREFLRCAHGTPRTAVNLYRVVTRFPWGRSDGIVEAESIERASRLVDPDGRARSVDVVLVEIKGESGIRWIEEDSPDSNEER